MATKAAVEEFISQRVLAVAGSSRSGKKFSNTVCRELKAKGYRIHPVHPHAEPVRSFHAFHRWLLRILGRLPR